MADSASGLKTILLVEDDPQVHELRATWEVQLALPVVIARDVDDALWQLRNAGPFALIIIDIMMTPGDLPGGQRASPLEAGYHLAVHIRDGTLPGCKTPSDVPILFYTAVASASLIEECRSKFGEANVVCKPCEPDRVSRRIREIFDSRCLVVCGAKDDRSILEFLPQLTPFASFEEVSAVAEAIERLKSGEYKLVLVLSVVSADDEQQLRAASRPERLLLNPVCDSQLPSTIARYV